MILQASTVFSIAAPPALHWKQLPPLPDSPGLASPFSGVSGGALLLAGGANFPDKPIWEGGTKVWHDTVHCLESPSNSWRTVGRLPRPLAYGAAVSDGDSVVCFGGSDSRRHYADGFRLTWKQNRLDVSPLPSLPKPCANMAYALAGRTLYIVGGTESPDSTQCLSTLWALDLNLATNGWRELAPCPGPARMLAVAGASGRELYLFSGASLVPGPDGKPRRDYLDDAWRYDGKWTRLSKMPRPAVAAPSPAPLVKDHLIIMTGDDGSKVGFQPIQQHPGFTRQIIAFDLAQQKWKHAGETPISRATVPVVEWRNQFVIPNGEARPGVRSPEVWTFAPISEK